jgi:lipopolysaccharide biosynthesis regulator YciM
VSQSLFGLFHAARYARIAGEAEGDQSILGMYRASSGYLELGMFDSAAQVLEEIAPEDKNRTEVLGMGVQLYMAAKKWDMAAAVASHLVKG